VPDGATRDVRPGHRRGTIDIQKVNIASALLGRRFNQRAR
jgi:hypothetical protein